MVEKIKWSTLWCGSLYSCSAIYRERDMVEPLNSYQAKIDHLPSSFPVPVSINPYLERTTSQVWSITLSSYHPLFCPPTKLFLFLPLGIMVAIIFDPHGSVFILTYRNLRSLVCVCLSYRFFLLGHTLIDAMLWPIVLFGFVLVSTTADGKGVKEIRRMKTSEACGSLFGIVQWRWRLLEEKSVSRGEQCR